MSECLADSEAAAIQREHLKADAQFKPICDDVGMCKCENDEFYFDGKECLQNYRIKLGDDVLDPEEEVA